MKKLLFVFICSAFITLTACNKFLDAVPYSITTTENFYKTAAEAEIALNGVYNVLNARNVQGQGNVSTFARDLTCAMNGATDEVVIQPSYNDVFLAPFGRAGFSSDNLALNNVWFFFYAGINRANFLLERLKDINDFRGARKVEVEAEAKLLRGFYHMYLSMMHGGIPVYDTAVHDPQKPRQSIQEVYTQVIADYEFAFNNLPQRASITGRVNKWTAAGLLAKAHTYLASAKTSGTPNFGLDLNSFAWVDANSSYQKALTYTSQIIQSGGYRLTASYDHLFREAAKAEQYQESLLTAEAANSSGMEAINMIVNGWCPQGNVNNFGGGYGFFRPTGEIHRKYHTTADVRFNHNLTSNFSGNPPVETVLGVRYYVPSVLPSNNTNPNVAGFSMGKFRAMDPKLRNMIGWANSINISLLRYADILLLHAEAQFFTGNEAGARATLSQLRERALRTGSNISVLNTAYFRADFVTELLDERSRELCFEQWRRIDLARFNRYSQTIADMSTTVGFYNPIVATIKQNWIPERIWFPIPLAQIDLNQNLKQNPGF
ncbi:MAG: RagB/SusD family nutrient uptake outer membrane protein [Bacteroidetes bacterium]|nr:MAG: RagB/SusD family nutrient uptake outer membrane protein [Bacteroidota bacterium]